MASVLPYIPRYTLVQTTEVIAAILVEHMLHVGDMNGEEQDSVPDD